MLTMSFLPQAGLDDLRVIQRRVKVFGPGGKQARFLP